MGRVEGKVALVTGAAVGLGCADAKMLAKEGARLIMTDIDVENGEAAAAAIRESGGDAVFFRQDASQEAEWIEIIDRIRDDYGRLDVLVNNAGFAVAESIDQCTLETFRRHNSVMNEGTFLGCKYALPLMAESGGGSIINMASVASHLGFPVYFAYSAAKGAIRSMTKALAVHCQWARNNVRVNSLHPGAIDTPRAGSQPGATRMTREERGKAYLTGRIGHVDEIAAGAAYLASDEASFMTGADLLIDGGFLAFKGSVDDLPAGN